MSEIKIVGEIKTEIIEAKVIVGHSHLNKSLLDNLTNENLVNDTSSTSISINLANEYEYRYKNANIVSISVTIPALIVDNFISGIVWKCAVGTTFSATNLSSYDLKIIGDGVDEGVFTPVEGKTYNMIFFFDGINVNCCVRGF